MNKQQIYQINEVSHNELIQALLEKMQEGFYIPFCIRTSSFYVRNGEDKASYLIILES